MTAHSTLQQFPIASSANVRIPIGFERRDIRTRSRGNQSQRVLRDGAAFDRARLASVPLWRESLSLLEKHVPFGRRKVKTDDHIYHCGQKFDTLYLVNSGLSKIISVTPDGREQLAGLYFKGDWLGFDGIPTGHHGCSAIALDSGEVWTVRYDALLQASAKEPNLLRVVLAAMSAQLARNRDATLSMGTLPADARVADFLLQWAHSLAERGLRTDQINVHMSRADMGNHLGLRLESVSRALSRLARCGIIEFNERGRRDISIPDLGALKNFIHSNADPAAHVVQ
jgi:CRP/FNR family transcriptional regulator